MLLKNLNQPIDYALFNIDQNVLVQQNSIQNVQPHLNSIIFGDFTQCTKEQLLKTLQITQICCQYFLQQADIVEESCMTQVQQMSIQQGNNQEVLQMQMQVEQLKQQLTIQQDLNRTLQNQYQQRNNEYLQSQSKLMNNPDSFKIQQQQQEINLLNQQIEYIKQQNAQQPQFTNSNNPDRELISLKQQYQLLEKENKRLIQLQQAPPYMKQMAAIKQANELIRQENAKLKKQVEQVQHGFCKCKVCFKYFETQEFLDSHVKRRHQTAEVQQMEKIINSYNGLDQSKQQEKVYQENFFVELENQPKTQKQQPQIIQPQRKPNINQMADGSFDSVIQSLEELDQRISSQNMVKNNSGISDKIEKLNQKVAKQIDNISAIEGLSFGQVQ